MALTLSRSGTSDLAAFAAGRGHPDFPCLSRTHSPSSCVPCADFSPWLRERVRWADTDAIGEYLWSVREANPGVGGTPEHYREHYQRLAGSILAAPLTRHLDGGSAEAYLDLRVALVLLAVHEGFSGFIMTGEAGDFLAAVMAPHRITLRDADPLVQRRNGFVTELSREMSYWAGWSPLVADQLPALDPPAVDALRPVLARLALLPLGARAHAVDALRHLSADPLVPRTLASLSRYETRKRGLDVTESTRRILGSGLVVPASDLTAWLAGWTRRDLLAFLAQSGLRPRNSWSKERLAEVALVECGDLLRGRMADSGAVELSPSYATGAVHLRCYVEAARETWLVWAGFGTGIRSE